MQYNFLIIDDEESVCQSIRTIIEQIGIDEFKSDIILDDCRSWEKGRILLENNYYDALILDANCKVEDNQEIEDFGFLPMALNYLKEIESKQNRHIPFAINTGYFGERELSTIKRLIEERNSKIFSKTSPKDDLVRFLMDEIEKAPETKLFRDYTDVFEIFDFGYLNLSLKTDLISILKKLNDTSNVKNNFNPLRKILEEVYEKIKQKDDSLIPDEIFVGQGGINLEGTWRYLSGSPVTVKVNRNEHQFQTTALFLKHISATVKAVKELSSTISHKYHEEVSIYAYKSTVFALLETLLWFKKFMATP